MSAIGTIGYWLLERVRDLLRWPVNLFRDGPRRVRRFAAVTYPGRSWKWRLHTLSCALFDLTGGPELAQFLMHLFMVTSPLTAEEIAAAGSILGSNAIRYGEVRIAERGILPLVFRHNRGRAFATWRSVHLPGAGHRHRGNLGLLIHELTHVYQYEQVGSRYIGEALHAQRQMGMACYHYGGESGLATARAAGRTLRTFNREAQAQIAQDYYMRQAAGEDLAGYESFIEDLRAGVC